MKEDTIAAGEFKAKCLALLDSVSATRRALVVTKRGRPVARLVPIEESSAEDNLRGSVLEEEDLISPLHDVWGQQ